MNGPTPGPQDADTPSPWSTISGLETSEKHQTTICCLSKYKLIRLLLYVNLYPAVIVLVNGAMHCAQG